MEVADMEETPGSKQSWSMTQTSFDLLLAQLDRDRESAGEKYQNVRKKLMNFFRWRGCTTPEDYADRTIDRVARRIEEGAEITARDPYLYFHGVAVNVLREHWKKAEKENTGSLEQLPSWQTPGEDPHEKREQETEALQNELRLECLNGCVTALPKTHLDLITQYHQGEGGDRIARRTALASNLGIRLNALRIRAYRVRGDLEKCVVNCVQERGS